MNRLNSLLNKMAMPKTQVSDLTERKSKDVNVRFDNIARAVSGQMPRRNILKMSVLGIAGAALLEIGIKPSWAAPTCLCKGQVYDPLTACCTAAGVQLKNPIADLSACPNRVPHPGWTPPTNGCGPQGGVIASGIAAAVPEGWGSADFHGCCNGHDSCYGTCNNSKLGCDTTFLDCMTDSCLSAYGNLLGFVLLPSCLEVAATYFSMVAVGGYLGPYNSGQCSGCDCCGTSTCPQTCAGGGCGSAPGCESDAECVCFQTVEGTGFCHRGQPCSTTSPCSSSAQCPAGWACVSVTCCGPQSICVRPCNAITPAGPSSLAASSGPTTTGF
jgi:hypothetical protein